MSRQTIRNLLESGISAKPIMTHGTSFEATIELGKTGKMPTGKCYVSNGERYSQDLGKLYFTPVTRNVKNPPEDLLDISRDESISESKMYAKISGFMHCMADGLGCTTSEAYDAIQRNFAPLGDNEKMPESVGKEPFIRIKSDLEEAGVKVSVDGLYSLYRNAKKRKGVIIEPNESIMELPHTTDFNRCALSFECPEGLDVKYIRGISLLGNVEKKLMDRFLDGKLKCNGFRTDVLNAIQ